MIESRHCILVAPNQPCVVECKGTAVTAFLDCSSPVARSCERGHQVLEPGVSGHLSSIVGSGLGQLERNAAPMLQALVSALKLERVSRPRDARSEAALEWLENNPFEPWSMVRLARQVGVSSSHLAHLLKRDFGVSARTLALYYRVRGGALELLTGAGTAAVAQQAGFSDQAHFARSLRRFFGKTSTSVRNEVRDQRNLRASTEVSTS